MRISFFTMPVLLLSLCALFPGNGMAELRITKMAADGRDMPLIISSNAGKTDKNAPITFESSTKSVTFQFETSQAVGKVARLKYKLEGYDPDWRDLKTHFIVWFRAVDRQKQVLAGDTVYLSGESRGWNGRADDTPLVPFRMSVTAQKNEKRFRIQFISDWSTPTFGHLVVSDVKLRVEHKNGTPLDEVDIACPVDSQADDKAAQIGKVNWLREGERPELAQVLRRTAPPQQQVLFLKDDDSAKNGCWSSTDITLPSVTEGDRVHLVCQIAYSIGSGATAGTAEYKLLVPGAYWFRVAAFQVNGLPTGEEVSLAVVVVPPLYQRTEFWLALMLVASAMTLLILRKVAKLHMLRRLEQAKRERLIEVERTRIARDIHDDLGATLAQIAMLSEIARTDNDASPAANRQHFNDIFSLAYESTAKLNEIIWAINPANDTLEHVVRYLCRFAERHLKLAGLRFRLEAPETMPLTILSSAQRHNLFLAAKEALHNAVKHAEATEIALRIRLDDRSLHIRIEDNGKGFVTNAPGSSGHGCENMKHRMEQINGTCQLTSSQGGGTVVEFALTLEKARYAGDKEKRYDREENKKTDYRGDCRG